MLTRARITAALAATLAHPAIALASGNVPPTPTLNSSSAIWLGYLIMAVLMIAVVAVSLMPSKRGHQD